MYFIKSICIDISIDVIFHFKVLVTKEQIRKNFTYFVQIFILVNFLSFSLMTFNFEFYCLVMI